MQSIDINLQNGADSYYKSGKTWQVTLGGGIPSVTFTEGTPITMYGLLPIGAEGFILELILPSGFRYNLCSPQTLALIMAALDVNPHYRPWANGQVSVAGRPITVGKTIPTIQITSERLLDIVNRQRTELTKAGVADAEYPFETAEILPGLPAGMLQQISYTLDPKTDRFVGTYSEIVQAAYLNMDEQWKESFLIGTQYQQVEGQFDPNKLQQYLRLEVELHNRIMADFNSLKLMFRMGVTAAGLPVLANLPLDTRTITDSVWSGDAGDPQNAPLDTITVPSETLNTDYSLASTTTTTTMMAAPIITTTTTQAPVLTTTTTQAPLLLTDQFGNTVPIGTVVL